MGIFSRLFKGEGEATDAEESVAAPNEAVEAEPPTIKKKPQQTVATSQQAPGPARAGRSPSKRSKPPPPPSTREPVAGGPPSSRGRSRAGKARSNPPSKRPRARPSTKPPKPESLPPLVLESDFPPNPPSDLPAAPPPAAPIQPQVQEVIEPHRVDEAWDLEAELEARFDASFVKSEPPTRPSAKDVVTTEQDMASIRDLFNDMAVHHMAQVRDLMLELGRVEVATTWVSLCEPTVESMRKMCQKLEMPELSLALEQFAGALGSAKTSATGMVQGELRDRLLESYRKMMDILPRAFELGTGRESMLVQLLLLQVPGVHKLAIDKLYAAGLSQLDAFLNAKPDEIAQVSGIDPALAERIAEHFRDYRRIFRSVLAEPVPAEERRRLAELVERLRDEHAAFQRASAGWSPEARADKKRLRKTRGETLSAVYVSLTRLGEVARVDALQTRPIERQLAELEEYLRQPVTQT